MSKPLSDDTRWNSWIADESLLPTSNFRDLYIAARESCDFDEDQQARISESTVACIMSANCDESALKRHCEGSEESCQNLVSPTASAATLNHVAAGNTSTSGQRVHSKVSDRSPEGIDLAVENDFSSPPTLATIKNLSSLTSRSPNISSQLSANWQSVSDTDLSLLSRNPTALGSHESKADLSLPRLANTSPCESVTVPYARIRLCEQLQGSGIKDCQPSKPHPSFASQIDEDDPLSSISHQGKRDSSNRHDQDKDFLRTNELLEHLISLLTETNWQNCSEVLMTTRPR
jgi:hypothetical protein